LFGSIFHQTTNKEETQKSRIR